MSKIKKSTQDQILEAADSIAAQAGLQAVNHKVIATALAKSSSNIVYHYPTALHLRRAAALRIVAGAGPQWGVIEFYVLHRLPEDHPSWLDHTAPTSQQVEGVASDEDQMLGELLVAEAFLWLARHGVADPVEVESA